MENDKFNTSPAPSISFVCTNTSDNMISGTRLSPPKALVDSSPLQPAMNKNKESLKVKLMVRRSVNQLVEQGIMPPLKTSPAIHEQRKQLERAKTGDLLKAKIQQRPDRHELERLHILEQQEGNIDPSLAEKRRMLEKARLADQLNSKISHRPGPLELIEKNILHTEEPIERIVKEGLVTFKSTNEAAPSRPQIPNSYVFIDDDTQHSNNADTFSGDASSFVNDARSFTSESRQPPPTAQPTTPAALQNPSNIIIVHTKYQSNVIPPPPPLPPTQKPDIFQQKSTQKLFAELCQTTVSGSNNPSSPLSQTVLTNESNSGAWSPISSISSPPSLTMITKPSSNISTSLLTPLQNNQKSDAPGKEKNRKKNKSKPVAKIRSIKFHEYKGPPNAQKSNSNNLQQNGETNYQLIMKQQYLLEYLEEMYKHPHILPANQKPSCTTMNLSTDVKMTTASPMQPKTFDDASPIPPSPASSVYSETSINTNSNDLSKLNRMKVSDLKQQCKKFNLPVSGPKPQLIERLKPYLEIINSDGIGNQSISNEDQSICGDTCDIEFINSPIHSLSPESDFENIDRNDNNDAEQAYEDNVVREQQRQIAELQRKLKQSQEELEHIRQKSNIQTISKQEAVNLKLKQQLTARLNFRQNSLLSHESQCSENSQSHHQKDKTQNTEVVSVGQKDNSSGKQNQNKNSVFSTQLNPSACRDNNINNANNKLVTFYDQKTLIPTLYVLSAPLPGSESFEKSQNNTKNNPFSSSLNSNNNNNNTSNSDQKPTGIVVPLPIINNNNVSLSKLDKIEKDNMIKVKCELNSLKKSEKEATVVSQDMTDVLEILLKNGEIPENLRTNSSVMNGENTSTEMIVDHHHSPELSKNILMNDNQTNNLLNYSVLSPMQQDIIANNDIHSDETLDKLLGQAQLKLLPDLNHPFGNNTHDHINNNDHNNMHHFNNTTIDTSTLMTDFSDIDLMEFQMDIDEDSCQNNLQLNRNNTITNNNGNTDSFANFSHCNGIVNTNNNNSGNMMKSHNNINNINSFTNRELNTTLQPSLSELMRQQSYNASSHTNPCRYNNYNINNFINSNNQHFHIDTMDFENLLSSFDIPSSLMLTNSSMCNDNNLTGTLNQNSETHNFQTHDNILDLFNDDYRMQNENLTCEVDNLLC